MAESMDKVMVVVEHYKPDFAELPFTLTRTWHEDMGLDVVMYLAYDAVNYVAEDTLKARPEIKDFVDYLLEQQVPVYVCGFCVRKSGLEGKLYPGIQVGNRRIFSAQAAERRLFYY